MFCEHINSNVRLYLNRSHEQLAKTLLQNAVRSTSGIVQVLLDLRCVTYHASSQTTEDVVLPPIELGQQPIFVSAGTRMQFSVMAMQRRTDLWGPDGNCPKS